MPLKEEIRKPNPEVQTAKNWYIWLWFSPGLTVPTFFLLQGFVYILFNSSYSTNEFTILMAILPVLGSALWHSILLIPALTGRSEFVRWHGRQALLLAGVRTAHSRWRQR